MLGNSCGHPVSFLCLSQDRWTRPPIVRTVAFPVGTELRHPAGSLEGGTVPDSGGEGSFGTAAVTVPWPRGEMTVRSSFGGRNDTGWDRREADHHDPEAAVTAGRIARPDAAGPCRRTEQRELPRASASAPTSGWCDGRELHRSSPAEDGTVRIDGGTRSDATDGGPTW